MPESKSNNRTRNTNRTYNKKNTNKAKLEEQNKMKSEIILLCIICISIMLFLCNFGLIGAIGDFISGIMFGMLGVIAYIAPVIFVFIYIFHIANPNNSFAKRKIIVGLVIVVLIGNVCAIFTEVISESLKSERSFFEIIEALYLYSRDKKIGGGAFFGTIAFLFVKYFDYVGTVLIILILLLICIVLYTQKSFVKGIKKGGKIAYDSAKNEARRQKTIYNSRRELAKERSDELRKQRLERENELNNIENEDVEISKNETVINAEKLKPRKYKKVTNDIMDVHLEATQATDVSVSYDMHEINISDNIDNIEEPIYEQIKIDDYNNSDLMINEPISPSNLSSNSFSNSRDIETSKKTETKKIPVNNNQKINIFNKNKYQFPPIALLKENKSTSNIDTSNALKNTANKLQDILLTFGVKVTITNISQGPSVTRFELQPEMGVKVSKIVGLADDIKLNLAATDIRIEAPIPGKAAVGIEVPNKDNSLVGLRELLETNTFKDFDSNIAFAVGKDISGNVVVSDIAKMPHMLVAGATGSGKSVCINTLIMSVLYKAHPDDVKLIMIDPKVVELSVYNGIPHLMIPVVTEPKKAAAALHWGVAEMTDRYKKFADLNVRDLKGYNKKIVGMIDEETGENFKKLPQIIIIVDELADLMMVAPGEVEESICRLAQLARAAGIHLIIATQRPSVDVITGLIKANMPSRVAFAVSSGIDSRTILDMNGAEKLLGKGDMLFYPQGFSKPARVQGAFVSDSEVSDVVDFLKNQAIGNIYSEDISNIIENTYTNDASQTDSMSPADDKDVYFYDAAKFIIEKEKASIGMLQRVFKIGFNRAARIMDQLASEGIVSEEDGTKPRKVNMTMEEFEKYYLGDKT